MTNELVEEEYKSASGERKKKLQREMKARGMKNVNKVRGGGLMRLPFLIIIKPVIDEQIREFQCRADPNCRREA
jgi:hypothetical protein